MTLAVTPQRRAIRSWEPLRKSALGTVFVLSLALGGTAQAQQGDTAKPQQGDTTQPQQDDTQPQQLDSVSREAASALAVAGLEAYEAGSYEEALNKLEKSYAVARVPTLGLWSARSLYKLGRWLEAEERYREASTLPLPEGDRQTQQQALVDARAELEALTPKIPSVVIAVEGARPDEIELLIDGKPASTAEAQHRLDPGPHHVEGARGAHREAVDVRLASGDVRTLLLRFPAAEMPPAAPAQAESSNWLRTSGWIAIGVGGAGVAVGTVALVLAIQKKNEIDHSDACQDNRCATSEQDLVDSYNSRRDLATVGFVAGGVLLAAGVGALVIGGKTPADPRAEAVFSPYFTGIRGSF